MAEIVGRYLPWLWLRRRASRCGCCCQRRPAWRCFVWLLTLYDTAWRGLGYAAYGGVYIGVALAWLWAVDGIRPTAWDGGCWHAAGDGDHHVAADARADPDLRRRTRRRSGLAQAALPRWASSSHRSDLREGEGAKRLRGYST